MVGELSWHWVDECRVCDYCEWFVLAEKFYYVCIGCERTQDKLTVEQMAENL